MTEVLGPSATQGELASAVNLTPDALSRALTGQRQFATLELVRIANYLHTSMHWLATGEQDPAATRVAARHSFDTIAQRHEAVDWSTERTAIESVASAFSQAFRDEISADPIAVPPSAVEAREALLRHDANYVRSFAEAVEAVFGIEVVRIPEATRPYSIEVVGRRIIVVAPHVNWFYQNWSIAHELGHFASGNLEPVEEAPVATGAAERDANAYAAELLLPERQLRAVDWSTMARSDIAENLWRWGVSTDAVKRRLAALRIVPGDDVREVLNMTTQKALRRHWVEPNKSMWIDEITDRMERANTRRFPSDLLRAHMEAVSSGRLRPIYLAWMLDTDPVALESELSPLDDAPDLDWMLGELGLDSASTT
ncbi:MAG: hypothetical protein JWQ39_1598 [Glaciihabitans sp.]|nr:hypothetical protein [Glaciihabitans sp.]